MFSLTKFGIFSSLVVAMCSVSQAEPALKLAATIDDEILLQSDSRSSIYPVKLESDVFNLALIENGGELLLPSVSGLSGYLAKITSIDTTTSDNGTVYRGDLYDQASKELVGDFIYTSARGSEPYLYVTTFTEGAYEIIKDPMLSEKGMVLKHLKLGAVDGVTDLDHEELLRSIVRDTGDKSVLTVTSEDNQRSDAARTSCNVAVGVGYTSAAKARNSSIISSITAWLSDLNRMVSEIGVTCNFTLVGTKQFNYVEQSSLTSDIYSVATDTQVANWKNNGVNADIFVMILSNAASHTDQLHGAALQIGQSSCSTQYAPSAKCAEYAVVRDDYAYSIRVFAHEVIHMTGVVHKYAYGHPSLAYGGAGFYAQNVNAENYTLANHYRATTVMTNPPAYTVMCNNSAPVVNISSCGHRLPFIASESVTHTVMDGSLEMDPQIGASSIRRNYYFPAFYPEVTTTQYFNPSPTMRSVIQNGMTILSTNQ